MYQLAVSRLFAIMPKTNRRTTRKFQRYSPKWLSIQIITDFLKWLSDFDIYKNKIIIKKQKKRITLFLTAYHFSLGVFFPAKDTKAGAIEGCQTWMSLTLSVTECMSSLDIYVILKPEAINILKLCVFLIVIFLLGLLHLDFNQVLRHEKNSLSSMPPTFPFTVCKPMPSARGMVLVALTAEYQVFESWPFPCALSVHLCMVALWQFNKDEVCWHILLTSIIYLPLQRRCMECSSFLIFP